MLEQTALRIGLLASPPPAEQMEALLDGLLTPDESMIRGPDGMEPFVLAERGGAGRAISGGRPRRDGAGR